MQTKDKVEDEKKKAQLILIELVELGFNHHRQVGEADTYSDANAGDLFREAVIGA